MKRNLLAIAIPALLVAGAANASIEIWNKDGNKLNVNGRVYASNYITSHENTAETDGDNSSTRLGFTGETQVTDSLVGYGRVEWNTTVGKDVSIETRYAFAGLKFGNLGSIDYGRNDGIVKTLTAYTDALPEFGGDAGSYNLGGRTSNVLTYRNADFFGLVDGLNIALQYADGDQYTDTNNTVTTTGYNRESYGVAVDYAILDSGFSVAGVYAETSQDDLKTWSLGAKYDANNLYVAGIFIQEKDDVEKMQGYEIVAQYGIDFEVGRLTPSVAYIQHKNKTTDLDKAKYVEVGATYDFNKNLSAVVDYKINLLDEDNVGSSNTKNVVALGLIYQF